MALLLLPQLLDEDGELWRRFSTIEEDVSALDRLLLQGNAISQYLDRPILGSAFVELRLLTYPHNLFIETAMALGVVGLVVLVAMLAGLWATVALPIGLPARAVRSKRRSCPPTAAKRPLPEARLPA